MQCLQQAFCRAAGLMLLAIPVLLAEETKDDPVARRFRTVTPFDVRGADIDLRLAIADRKLAKAELELAQSERLTEIHAKVAEQSERLRVLLQKTEYVSDILRATAENPYGVIGLAMQGDQGLSLRKEQMRRSGKISRDGESIDELQALEARFQDDVRKIVAEHDQLLAVVKQNQENYYREQALENQQAIIKQQQDSLEQQKQSADKISDELRRLDETLRSLR